MRETILFFLIVMINGLICIGVDIWLDTTFVGLLYHKGDKLEKVCTGYKDQPTTANQQDEYGPCNPLVGYSVLMTIFDDYIVRNMESGSKGQ